MNRHFACYVITLVLLASIPARAAVSRLTSLVNPFVGTAPSPFGQDGIAFQSGDTFPGAAYPQGMVQFSPDTPTGQPGGYFYNDNAIIDFSLTHFSGRGCQVYQNFPIVPYPGSVGPSPGADDSAYVSTFSHANEVSHPGYYRVKLDNGVTTELTVAPRTGFARFTFPKGSAATLLIGDKDTITITGPSTLAGSETRKVGCGSEDYTIYFYAAFDRKWTDFGTWNGGTVTSKGTSVTDGGAYVTFDATTNAAVEMRIGISFVSTGNAEANLLVESGRASFDAIESAADSAWNNVLKKVTVDGGTEDERSTFYTALYHCFFHPNVFNDVNGQYRGIDGMIHIIPKGHKQYENIPGWDQYRSEAPLLAILAPNEMSDIAQSLINDAVQDAAVRPNGGGFPRWEQANRNSGGMIGDSDDVIVADAYAYGATDFDTADALNAMLKGSSIPDATSDGNLVRPGLAKYLSLGYGPGIGYGDSASATLEYSSDDFAVSQFAQALGKAATAQAYLKQAQNWKNLLNPASGYIQPRNADGTWNSVWSPSSVKGFVEGTSAQYTWMAPFNLAQLSAKMGGPRIMTRRLDSFFQNLNDGIHSVNAYMGNEPCEEAPWEYDFAGAPAKTQSVVRRIQTTLFSNNPGGLPGNDDAGAISSWYVFASLGLYPEIPGVAGLVVGSPLFENVRVHLEVGKTIEIRSTKAGDEDPYVQSLAVDGEPYISLWIPWSTLSGGARLAFTLGKSASGWATDPSAAPPSFDVPQ